MVKLISALAGFTAAAGALLPGEQEWSHYDQYLKDFTKEERTAEEHAFRKKTFEANLDFVKQHNSNPAKTWYATVNEFADWTFEEFKTKRAHGTGTDRPITQNKVEDEARLSAMASGNLPDSVDWRVKTMNPKSRDDVVSPVKNQGGCGSCWAFSTVETMESALALATGKPAPVLSPQQVVSCAPNPKKCGGSGGCNGATQDIGFNYTEAGLTSESDYPYRGTTGTCQTSKIKPVAKNTGYVKLPSNNYTALMTAVANVGPIAISVAAGAMGWQEC